MNGSARNLVLLLFVLALFVHASDEQQKAHKVLNKLTAMAIDPSGKRAVSLAVSEYLSLSRAELAQRRHITNLNYGGLFVAYQLVKSGAKMDDIAARIKAGKTIWQIADEAHTDWKQITSEAKKVNGRVDANLLRLFNNDPDAKRNQADNYDPFPDTVAADNDVSRQEIDEAQQSYVFLRQHAGVGSDAILDTSTEKSARMVRTDPVRTGGPSGGGAATTPPRN
jgi:hypothetical protein